MVLPPPAGQGLQIAEFARINRRFLMENDKQQLLQQFSKDRSNLYQVSGIAHWQTPEEDLVPVLGMDDTKLTDGSYASAQLFLTSAIFVASVSMTLTANGHAI